jgi:glutathione S-transferase
MTTVLYIGNKNYSSWSLRPWLVLRWANIPFEERLIRLDQPGYGEQKIVDVLGVSPTGRVPCLHADGLVVWDSLAIAEWAAEMRPDAKLWPADPKMRAEARAVSAEMHSGFANVRRDLSMNIHRRIAMPTLPPETLAEIARLDGLWKALRARHQTGGPWLFGARTIADAFYAPVATRMRTYGVPLSPASQDWCAAVFADADFRDWEAASIPDSWDVSGYSVIDGKYA